MNIMESKKLLIVLTTFLLLFSCKEDKKSTKDTNGVAVEVAGKVTEETKAAADKVTEGVDAAKDLGDEVEIKYDKNFKSIYTPKSLESFNFSKTNLDNFSKGLKELDDNINNNSGFNSFYGSDCWDNRLTKIEELTDGVLIDAYSFDQGDESKLGLLGFFNVELSKKQKVIVVEYSQEGTQYCGDKRIKFGIGARLMMKVTRSKRSAKLNTPQQITASVVFGKAEVTYSLRTFGITGPGIGKLNKTGSLSEDTYQEFIQEISNLIVEMYKNESSFKVVPQPLAFKK